ncbi:hypothetical protein AB0L59_07200 [Streptomyces sp. NPDC052109]|uniref:hypothetical protein n=1 Tax=Streptomyces sp. NPDC052109 TaxID=3155527 RepID=UPI0034484C31
MTIVLSTLKRAAGPVLVAGLVVASSAGPAAAARTPGSTAYRIFGGFAGLQARSGVQNHVTTSVSNNHPSSGHRGRRRRPGLYPGVRQQCRLRPPRHRHQPGVQLGDMHDTAVASVPVNSVVDAGTGIDSVTTSGGNGTVFAVPGDSIAGDCEVKHLS